MAIPKTLHHIWLGPLTRPFLAACRQSFMQTHVGWSFRYHKESSILDHPELRTTGIKELYQRCKSYNGPHNPKALMADALRLAVLYAYGGFYVDHDLFSLRSLSVFVDDDLVLSQIRPNFIGEAVIGAPPRSERIMEVIRNFVGRSQNNRSLCMGLTGLATLHRWPSYPPIVFCPHPRKSSNADRYIHDHRTWSIHCWNQKKYDLGQLARIQGECSILPMQKPEALLLPN